MFLKLIYHIKLIYHVLIATASGGYYLAMACDEIVAERQTLTGSIGVVSAKFSTEQLRQTLGLHTEAVSIGRYAEVA